MYRRHPVPGASAFDSIVEAGKYLGVTIDPTTSKALAQSLNEAQVSQSNPRRS